jgi:hypothetical protein
MAGSSLEKRSSNNGNGGAREGFGREVRDAGKVSYTVSAEVEQLVSLRLEGLNAPRTKLPAPVEVHHTALPSKECNDRTGYSGADRAMRCS